jgi:hypothetical protein
MRRNINILLKGVSRERIKNCPENLKPGEPDKISGLIILSFSHGRLRFASNATMKRGAIRTDPPSP